MRKESGGEGVKEAYREKFVLAPHLLQFSVWNYFIFY